MQTYYSYEEQGLHENVTNYQRLMMYLNHRQYYSEYEMRVYLSENGLDGSDTYDKNTNYRKMLCAVLDILESLLNNIDLFRTVEVEFATASTAYNALERRIQKLKQRIDEIPDEPVEGGRGSDFTHIFYNRQRNA